MAVSGISFREVVPDFSQQENWIEVTLNTGGTQSTLQDIKVAEKAGGYCYEHVELIHNRNRYIYWRSYKDILELTEISLDLNLYQNNLRYKFTDSPVIGVSIFEQERYIVLLVTTVSSLHRINFPHPDVLADGSCISSSSGSASASGKSSSAVSLNFHDSQTYSIFRDANTAAARDSSSFYVVDIQTGTSNNAMPYTTNSYLSIDGNEAYFAYSIQDILKIYIMNSETGTTSIHQLKEHYSMPRIFSNIKGALIGRSENTDAELVTSLAFIYVNEQIYLLALYRNDMLRVWSVNTLQNVASINCVRETQETRMQGPQSNSLRKINDKKVCVFLSHATGAEFVCIDIQIENVANNVQSKVNLVRRKVISAPQLDLADFDVSATRIWALWSNAEGEFSISNFSLVQHADRNWVTAAMEPPPDRYSVVVEQGMDPREAYCSYIFHPGKFERSVIAKALFMFRRSNVRYDAGNIQCNIMLLKEHVCQAVDEEIQHEMKEYDLSHEEFMEIAMRQWERFYSCCEQYHMKSCQPIGLAILEPLGAACVIKKNNYSLLRPCETLEQLMLTSDNNMYYQQTNLKSLAIDNEEIETQMVHLVATLALIENWLPEDSKIDLDKRFYQLEKPNIVISQLTDDIIAGDADREIFPHNYLVNLRQKLQNIKDITETINALLNILRQPLGNMQTQIGFNQSTRFLMSIGTPFGSHAGLSILSETVRQIASIRFAICRNLLILQQLLLDTKLLPMDLLETIRTQFMPETAIFLQSYYVMVWICETPVNIATAAALETSVQRLQLLQLTCHNTRISLNNGKCYTMSLLRVFLNSKGLYTALLLFMENYKTIDNVSWNTTLIPLAITVSQLIWSVSTNFNFGEWLFSTCQHTLIQDYVRLLNDWCEWNTCSRQFIYAVSLLDSGETNKAYDLFLQSARGVLKESFLNEKIIKDTQLLEKINEGNFLNDTTIYNQAVSQYYLKVIQLFEQHNAWDHIISMAQVAIALLAKDNSQLPMFQSIVFNNHLQLEHYEEAYNSLIYNAELCRRKDCLRQLVITLFERKRLDLLMNFPYIGLHEEFENIVESRARSQLIIQNEIYDFLYAFHINNGNMRKASAIMYEQAMRFQLECDTLEGMKKRCACLLVCINALHLIDPRYRWIAKPVIGNDSNRVSMEDLTYADLNQQAPVVVLEIHNIQRELLHTEALVHLAQHRKDIHTFLNADAEELTIILCGCGLFTAAFKLAKGFNISLLPLFDSLTAACVRTSDESASNVWMWLQENDLADLPHHNKATDMAWSLLEKLVRDNVEENSTQIYEVVVNKLLSLNAFVPQWLLNEYKLKNCPELLRLFVKQNRLLEASELAIEMMKAMLGLGSEYFSFKHPITITNPQMCLPLNTLDLLLYNLKLNADEDIEYKQSAIELEEVLQNYIKTALHTAEDKMQFAIQKNQMQQQLQI